MLRLATLLLTLAPLAATAEAPRVVTDIAPVHSLVAAVMEGAGTPDVILPANTDAHHFSLKPSQARAMADARLVVWIGPDLTPALRDSLASLAPDAVQLVLSTVPGLTALPYRDADAIGTDHDDHDHQGAIDPHLWLSPANARLWLAQIATGLATLDPDNAALYAANAEATATRIAQAEAQAATLLAPLKGLPIAVAHDAYQYFENTFGLTVIGAITDSEATAPGPAHLDHLRDTLAATPPACILTGPGDNEKLLRAVAPDARQVLLDPQGWTQEPGPGLYPALILDLAARIATCAD